MCSSLKYLKDVYLQCNINNTNGYTSRIARDLHLRPCLRKREKKNKVSHQGTPLSSIPHDLVSSTNCIRGPERDYDMYGPQVNNHKLEQMRQRRNKGSSVAHTGVKNSQKKSWYVMERILIPHESGGPTTSSF